jgi:iron complex transport system ATP-binding protein
MSTLAATAIGVTLGGRRILDSVDLSVGPGDVVGLLGPNGAGKSTLLRVLANVLDTHAGEVTLEGRPLGGIPPRERARSIAYLPQNAACHWPMAVEQVVALGRLPHRLPWAAMSTHDWDCVTRAMHTTDVEQFRGRSVGALSMGLDPAHQLEVMAMLERMAADGAAVIVVLHDLTLAARHCSRLALLGAGRLVAQGDADTVLSTEHLRDCFGIRALSGESPEGRYVIPVERITS